MDNVQLYSNIIKFISTMCDNNVHQQAIMNALNSKIAWMVSLRGVKFKQYTNSKEMPITYYGYNFVSSGSHKDYAVRLMNDYLFDFCIEFMSEKLKEARELESKKPEKDQMPFRSLNIELANPNYTGLYQEAVQQQRLGGSLYIRIGELGDYLTGITTGNQSKRELYDKLKDIYDGDIYPNVVAIDKGREPVFGLPIQCLMYSDLDPIKDSKVKRAIMTSLKSGMARRSFLFVPKDNKVIMNYPLPTEQKEEAIASSVALRSILLKRFYTIPQNAVYTLSPTAQALLAQYRQECIDFFNAYDEEEIVRIERKESWWKVLKLGIALGVLAEPQNLSVGEQYLKQAIDFNLSLGRSLSTILNLRHKDDFDVAIQYFRSRIGEIASRADLRALGIGKGDFARWILKNEELLAEELEIVHGIKIIPFQERPNVRSWQVIKIGEEEENERVDTTSSANITM